MKGTLPELDEAAGRLTNQLETTSSLDPPADASAATLLAMLENIERGLKVIYEEVLSLKNGEEDSEYLTVAEAAKVLHRSRYTVRRWLRNGTIRGAKAGGGNGGRYLIHREEIESFLEQTHRYHG